MSKTRTPPSELRYLREKRAYWKAHIDPDTVPKTLLRICTACGEEKQCGWNHMFTLSGKPEYKARCQECEPLRLSKNRKRDRAKLGRVRKEKCRALKKRCVQLLGGACSVCGYNKSMRALTFHHRDSNDKTADVSFLVTAARPWTVILEELKKCDLLCFNCHMEEEEQLDAERIKAELVSGLV